MYKRIAAGVDGSTHAEHALQHAIALAKALGAALRIVHVVDMGWLPVAPEVGLDLAGIAGARRAEGEALLARGDRGPALPARRQMTSPLTHAKETP